MKVSNKNEKKRILSRNIILSSAFAVMILTPSTLYSYNNGILGSTSSASMLISLIIPPKLETNIANELDLSSLKISPTTNINESIPLCIRSNSLTNYTVTAQSHKTEEYFSLKNGENEVPYDIILKRQKEGSFKVLKSGQPSQLLNTLSRDQSCDESPQLSLKVNQIINKSHPIYGALTLTLSAY